MIKSAVKSLVPISLLNLVAGRKNRIFALGPPKSGTTSIASIFSEYCRADHEAHRPKTVREMHAHFVGEISDEELMGTYRARDKQLMLRVESNCFLAYRPDLLSDTFPDSRFVIAVREPKSWLKSIVDNNINFPRNKNEVLTQWHHVFFGDPERQGTEHDAPLASNGLYPLASYLEYWTATYRKCLELVPVESRLVVSTSQISERKPEILTFAGFTTTDDDTSVSHSNKTKAKHGVLDDVDDGYIDDMVKQHCAELIEQHELAALWG